MSDRLTELQRQRALAQEQLTWFDREIARESAGKIPAPVAPVAPVTPPVPLAIPVPVPTPASAPGLSADKSTEELEAERILERYRHSGHPVKDEVKRGCLLYFFGAFGLLFLAIAAFWLLRRH